MTMLINVLCIFALSTHTDGVVCGHLAGFVCGPSWPPAIGLYAKHTLSRL